MGWLDIFMPRRNFLKEARENFDTAVEHGHDMFLLGQELARQCDEWKARAEAAERHVLSPSEAFYVRDCLADAIHETLRADDMTEQEQDYQMRVLRSALRKIRPLVLAEIGSGYELSPENNDQPTGYETRHEGEEK